jgi:Big-like domain-containing protein
MNERHFEECICHELRRFNNLVERFLHLAFPPLKAVSASEELMPATVAIGGTAISTFTEFDANGNVVPNSSALAFTSSNTAVATVDPVAGTATGVSAGTATITGTDPTNGNVSASDTLTVTPAAVGPAVSATEVLTAVTPVTAAAVRKLKI